jgi:hypothetical protein
MLENLPTTTPDGRAIHQDLLFVVTGVPRAPDFGQWEPEQVQVSEGGKSASPSEEQAPGGPLSRPEPTYIRTTIRNGDDEGDPGAIAEARWSVDDGCVTLTDLEGRHLSGRALLKGQDPAAVARALLREVAKPKEFNRPIIYPKMGLA